MKKEALKVKEIQGLLIRGYGSTMSGARYLMLVIEDANKFQVWLSEHHPDIASGDKEQKPKNSRIQIAFTWPGLEQLGMNEDWVKGFRSEFIQGMDTPYRARILGDLDDSGSEHWEWGNKHYPVHLVLMMFAPTNADADALYDKYKAQLGAGGLREVVCLDSRVFQGQKEHFGFHDGISQPFVEDLSKTQKILENLREKIVEANKSGDKEKIEKAVAEEKEFKAKYLVADGEFFMGYPNAYGEYPPSPEIINNLDPDDILPSAEYKIEQQEKIAKITGSHAESSEYIQQHKDHKDFGKYGSYMVFRQLRQDVAGFWTFMKEAVLLENQGAEDHDAVKLATKMVGRWPGGAPLVLSPDKDDPKLAKENYFQYEKDDLKGYKCPISSHVRRANPRDVLQNNKPERAATLSNRHRILRRGRNFGEPLVPDFDPSAMIKAEDDHACRGLHFICFNTNIARQFEFIQHTWSDNLKFEGLYNDPDPILGIRDWRRKSEHHDFTIPQYPVRRKIRNMKRFVHTMGGAYFFMPGMKALKYLATFKPPITTPKAATEHAEG